MTIREMKSVYNERVILTSIAFEKKTGEYYSFRTIGDFEKMEEIPDDFQDMEILSIRCNNPLYKDGNFLWIDIAEYFDMEV